MAMVMPEASVSGPVRERRIFFDFAKITRFTHQSGIPRVAYALLREMSALEADYGLTTIPCYVERDRLKDATHALDRFQMDAYLSRRSPLYARAAILADYLVRYRGVRQDLALPFTRAMANRRLAPVRQAMARDLPQDLVATEFSGRFLIHETMPGDILFTPAYWHDIDAAFYAIMKKRGLAIVPLIHDVLPVLMPENYHWPWVAEFEHNLRNMLVNANLVFTVSGATKTDVLDFARRNKVPAPPVVVAHNGCDIRTAPEAPGLRFEDRRYVLLVGSIEPKKNHRFVADACERLWRQGEDFELVCIGRPGWAYEEILADLKDREEYGRRLHLYDDVDDAGLAEAYAGAQATIMASENEGFGIPVVESLRAGTPVILSDIPVFREIAGKDGVYFAPGSEEALAARIQEVLEGGKAACAPENFTWPTWRDTAEQILSRITLTETAAAAAG